MLQAHLCLCVALRCTFWSSAMGLLTIVCRATCLGVAQSAALRPAHVAHHRHPQSHRRLCDAEHLLPVRSININLGTPMASKGMYDGTSPASPVVKPDASIAPVATALPGAPPRQGYEPISPASMPAESPVAACAPISHTCARNLPALVLVHSPWALVLCCESRTSC
jgi:hypothetical protein